MTHTALPIMADIMGLAKIIRATLTPAIYMNIKDWNVKIINNSWEAQGFTDDCYHE